MEEEDYFTQTQLPALIAALAAAALDSPFFFFVLFTFSLSALLKICCSLSMPIYRQEWCHQLQLFFNSGGCINGGSTWVAPFCQWLVQLSL
jgi:hypothetical protein